MLELVSKLSLCGQVGGVRVKGSTATYLFILLILHLILLNRTLRLLHERSTTILSLPFRTRTRSSPSLHFPNGRHASRSSFRLLLPLPTFAFQVFEVVDLVIPRNYGYVSKTLYKPKKKNRTR